MEIVPTELSVLESTIERGLATFVEVGGALMRIRDERLYRESHATFEQYCREKWGWSRQRSHQLIGAAKVSTIVDNPPTNEAQARELAKLPETEIPEAWETLRAEHGDDISAKVIETEVATRTKKDRETSLAALARKAVKQMASSAKTLEEILVIAISPQRDVMVDALAGEPDLVGAMATLETRLAEIWDLGKAAVVPDDE